MINAYSSAVGPGRWVIRGVVDKYPTSSPSPSPSTSEPTPTYSSDPGTSEETEETKETLDWIERKIKEIEREIENLEQKASATYKSWSTRNSALASEMTKVTEEISIQEQAYQRYMQEANSVGLSEEYASKVRNGTIDIETITDENLIEQINEYQEWYITCHVA